MNEMQELKQNTKENNLVTLRGRVSGSLSYSHTICGEKFYHTFLTVNRHSPARDEIPALVSERILETSRNYDGCQMDIQGELRSYNYWEQNHHYVELSVFAQEVRISERPERICYMDSIFLDGYICKKPVYRLTPLGREIADVMMAVNRSYGRSDYIPCIFWGRNARYAIRLRPGMRILLWGRLQSREYIKKLQENLVIRKTAYEVSARKILLSGMEN